MDKKANKKFYRTLYRKYGLDARSLGWGNRSSQLKRLKVIADNIWQETDPCFVLDIGCGFGDFLRYYNASEECCKIYYLGIDPMWEFIKEASQRHESGAFIVADLKGYYKEKGLLPQQNVIASGLFSHVSSYSEIEKSVKMMGKIFSRRLIFNCLRYGYKGKQRSQGEFYARPEEVVEICRRSIDPKIDVHLIFDYLPNDFTVIVEKEE